MAGDFRPTSNAAPLVTGRAAIAPIVIAWLFVVFDGYDLIVYGTVATVLSEEWGLNSTQVGTVGSLAFVGMMIGALVAGRLADGIGRKRAIILSGIVLSVFTALCAVATNVWVFGALRLLAGIGLGGLVPSANALAADLVPPRWRATVATLMMSGVPLGGSIAAVLGLGVIDPWGWRPMFAFALIPLLVLVPWAWVRIPDDRRVATAGTATVEHKAGFGTLLRPPFLAIGLLFAASTVVTLMAWYGLGTWLPSLMRSNGADLGPALLFALALNLGAILGSVVTAWAGDRFGTVITGSVAAALAGGALLLLLTDPPTIGIYAIMVLAGVGTHGTQCLIIAAIATYYPDNLRGTALGMGLGLGRIGAVLAPQLGGIVLAAFGVNAAFVLFAACALAAAIGLLVIWSLYGGTYAEGRRGRVAAPGRETAPVLEPAVPASLSGTDAVDP